MMTDPHKHDSGGGDVLRRAGAGERADKWPGGSRDHARLLNPGSRDQARLLNPGSRDQARLLMTPS